jgi:glycosyltransferase involved in cell wall biosynthesis
MSILVLIGSWKAPSELFILRQLRMLEELGRLNAIVAARLHGNTNWNGYDVIGLSDQNYELLGEQRPNLSHQRNKLSKLIRATSADTIFCHFGTIATLFFDLLSSTSKSKSMFIHMHGKDSHAHMHNSTYIEKIKILSTKAILICNPITYELLSGENWDIPENRLRLKKVYGVEVPNAPYIHHPKGFVTILHLGRLVDFKGPDKTIKAFELACQKGLKGKLLIAGDGPLMNKCKSIIKGSPWKKNH